MEQHISALAEPAAAQKTRDRVSLRRKMRSTLDRHYKSSFSCIICVRFVDEIRVRTERRVSWNVELSIFPQECSSSQTMAESYKAAAAAAIVPLFSCVLCSKS